MQYNMGLCVLEYQRNRRKSSQGVGLVGGNKVGWAFSWIRGTVLETGLEGVNIKKNALSVSQVGFMCAFLHYSMVSFQDALDTSDKILYK